MRKVTARSSKPSSPAQQFDLFKKTPAISGKTNGSGRDIYYDTRRMNWTTDPAELDMTDDELRAHRLKQFDEVFGPDEAWR